MTRFVIVALLAACGTPAAQPVTPTAIEEDDRPVHLASVARPDAAIDTPTADAPVQTAVATVADASIDAPASDVTAQLKLVGISKANRVTVEGGITVAFIGAKFWCAQTGKLEHLCVIDRALCARIGRCTQADAVACSAYTDRTSGKTLGLCFDSYEACDGITDNMTMSPEMTDIEQCTILRFGK